MNLKHEARKARESVRQQVTIGFDLILIGWESGVSFFKPITKRGNAKII